MKDPEDEAELLNLELGSKMVLLMDILKESYLIGNFYSHFRFHNTLAAKKIYPPII